MTATRRWCLVALGVLLLVAAPFGVSRLLPADAAPVTAAELLARIEASRAQAYSGEVATLGTLGLPVTDQFTNLAGLFGQRSQLRVWWRTADDWRVDQLSVTGETDLIHDSVGTTSWDYESNRATRTGQAVVRLPQASDLLPPSLARLLLESASVPELSRLPAKRLAGIAAPGLRLTPNDPKTSIARVDVWVEPRTGLPLEVAVYAARARTAALTSTFSSVSLAEPSTADTSFDLPPGARSRFEEIADLAAAANAFAPVVAPATLSGLTRRDAATGAVGVYGRGASLLIAIPLRGRIAGPLRSQLLVTPGASDAAGDISLSDDPLTLLLTGPTFNGQSWLLAGTLTRQALATAATEVVDEQLPANPLAARP